VATVPIPLFDTSSQLAEIRSEVDRRIGAVLDSGRFILGPELVAFERELAEFLDVDHVVGVANGTDALTIALRALGVGPGDDVVVPSFTFYATAEAVVNVGARPVFCDIDPGTFCVTAETVERALTGQTRAVVPVHLFGTPAPMEDLRKLATDRGVKLLEDAAQAAGARAGGRRAGALGDAAAFSFFPSKNLFCLGDGGAVATSNGALAEHARLLRLHGSTDKRLYLEAGYNSRLDALQAAVLRLVLSRLDGWNAARRDLAGAYAEAGLGELVLLPRVPEACEPVHHMYVVRSSSRDDLLEALGNAGIEGRACYPTPVHRQPAMQAFARDVDLPGTEIAAASSLALPMGPSHGPEVARSVVEALHQSLNSP
jgi:dTDP-3-amino-3,4,6-trideoxy-alpha-D-glucose transaminase